MQFGVRALVAIATFLACTSVNDVSAQENVVLKPLERPDPATITVPRVVTTSDDDYFIFQKNGVSYEKAFSDLDECRMYSLEARVATVVVPPKFMPLGSAANKGEGVVPSDSFMETYGVVGLLVAMPFLEGAERDAADAANRRCMTYKGYSRYGTTRAIWKQITDGTDAEKIARLALIASGPQPPTGGIGP